MTADTFDSILGLLLMGTGNDPNSWGTNANNSVFSPVARAIAGQMQRPVTGGTLDVSANPPPNGLSGAIDFSQTFTGTLTSNQTFILPNVGAWHLIENATSGAFSLLVTTASGINTVEIPQGTMKLIYVQQSNFFIVRMDNVEVGMIAHFGNNFVPHGYLACNGASLLRTDHPDLFAAIGTTWGNVDGTHFTLPNLTDTNRYLRAGGGSGPAVGTYQSNQNLAHSHTVTGAPSAGTLGTDSQGSHSHTANVTDPGHTHAGSTGQTQGTNLFNIITAAAPGSNNTGSNNSQQLTITNATTGISVSIVSAGAHTHNITGAPGLGTLGTGSSGGSESRPESAAVTVCIRY